MISDRALGLALNAAVLTPDQVERLRSIERDLASGTAQPPEPADDESLRFITGFGDLFVTIGIVLFLGALAFLMDAGTRSTPMYAGLAICAWLLAEFFTLKRRMALPSIVLLVIFAGAVFVLAAQVCAALLPSPPARGHSILGIIPSDLLPLGLAAIITAGMAALHYLRFRVPITIAAGAAALCVLFVTVAAGLSAGMNETALNVVLLLCGLAVFALAMRFDVSDPARVTRRTDIAFWLHLLAAPLIVHPLIRGFLHGLDQRLTSSAALGILGVFVALGAVAVVIDRRAILVSGLVYAGFALSALIRAAGLAGPARLVPIVIMALGGFILLLSAGWLPLRRAILRRLPRTLAGRLPHPLVSSTT